MNGDPLSNYQNNPLVPTYSLDQSFRHESRELDPFDRAWFAQMATATDSDRFGFAGRPDKRC
jgi:hypothetical protein